jgi:hypothetical protein
MKRVGSALLLAFVPVCVSVRHSAKTCNGLKLSTESEWVDEIRFCHTPSVDGAECEDMGARPCWPVSELAYVNSTETLCCGDGSQWTSATNACEATFHEHVKDEPVSSHEYFIVTELENYSFLPYERGGKQGGASPPIPPKAPRMFQKGGKQGGASPPIPPKAPRMFRKPKP